jgi:hypothetical protein
VVSYDARRMAKARHSRASTGVLGALLAVACGGGSPLLHPAHVLPEGQVSGGAGVSGQFAFGEAARAMSAQPPPGDEEQQFVEHAVAEASLAPGIAPWVGARVGLGAQSEAGLTYTGRSARIDARHAFGDETVAYSIGAGATAILANPESHAPTGTVPEATAGRLTGSPEDPAARGWGLDVPAIVGWRSSASVVELWTGVRAGVEHVGAAVPLGGPTATLEDLATLSGMRWYGGGLVGAAIGFRPIWIALELDASYQYLSVGADFTGTGTPAHREATLTGLTLAPAGAIIGKF